MRKVINNIKYSVAALCTLVCMSSCEDFLSIVPLNDIVLENFWENESEVNTVVTSCYSGIADGNFLKQAMMWGELRSDNVTKGLINDKVIYVNHIQLPEMLEGNILPTHDIADPSRVRKLRLRHSIPSPKARNTGSAVSTTEITRSITYLMTPFCRMILA